ncbi:MAG: hypothetical protein ACLTA5_05265 [Anaerococcus obesiensis]
MKEIVKGEIKPDLIKPNETEIKDIIEKEFPENEEEIRKIFEKAPLKIFLM